MFQLSQAKLSHVPYAIVVGAVLAISSLNTTSAHAQSHSAQTSSFRDLTTARAQLERVSHGPRTQPRQGLLAVAQDSFACWSAQANNPAASPVQEEAAACREDFWSAVTALDSLSSNQSDVAHAR